MNTKFFITLLLTLLAINHSIAQNYSSKNKRAIKYYEKAREYLKNRKFDEGLEFLQKAVEADDKFAEAHYQLATSYQMFQRHDKMLLHYRKTVEAAPDNRRFAGAYYFLTRNAMKEGDYAKVKELGNIFLKMGYSNKGFVNNVKKAVADAEYASEKMKNPLDFKPVALESPINKFALQYSPVLTADQSTIFFTIRTAVSRQGQEDIYISNWDGIKWSEPTPISQNINSPGNEGTCSISADGKTLVFTSCEQRIGTKYYGKCDLYVSYKIGEDWTTAKNLGKNVNSPHWDTQPALSSDGKTLYFISSRPNGQGGNDIWYSKKDDNGQWTEAENLGATVNTPRNELAPFMHSNGKTLFFTSDGHRGFGGHDLYKSDFINHTWTKPENLGYPINTHDDQFGISVTADGKKAYYSVEESKRGYIEKSILHTFDFPEEIKLPVSNYVKGIVYDSLSKKPIQADIELFDVNLNDKQSAVSSDAKNGSYLFTLAQGSEYALVVSKKGYALKSVSFNYTEVNKEDMQPIILDIPLVPIKKGIAFRLENIFFETAKYDLKDKSKSELDKLVIFMQDNDQVKGEISGHTDNVGTKQGNMTLSLNRAKAVYNYLLEKGIAKERLSFKGYGDSQPATTNATEEGRAKNRRIEFKILSND